MRSERNLKIWGFFYVSLFIITFVLTWIGTAHCQVPVAMAPPIHFQFFNASGQPLANGKVFTYSAGTTTCQNTYTDSTGLVQNPCVLLLDATGSPANGSNQVGIFLANQAYKFVAFDVNNVQQWQVDNVTTYFALLNSGNTWTAAQTFSSTITDVLADNQMIFGTVGNQTTLDFPPPAGNITLHMPSTADTMVGRATTDSLSNKTLIGPNINGVCSMNGGPGTYVCLQNSAFIGTTVNTLTKLVGFAAAQIAATTDTGGVVGICVSGCGTTGGSVIQESGQATCVFDGATTAGDYVQISSTTNGNCHDAGTSQPSGTQNIGRVLTTIGGVGGAPIILNPSFAVPAASVLCSNATPVTVNANTAAQQAVQTCKLTGGSINSVGKTFRFTTQVQVNPAGTSVSLLYLAFGTTAALSTSTDEVAGQASAATAWNAYLTANCVVGTAGATGSITCSTNITIPTSAGSAAAVAQNITFSPLNLTTDLYVGDACTFQSASASNTCIGSMALLEQLN